MKVAFNDGIEASAMFTIINAKQKPGETDKPNGINNTNKDKNSPKTGDSTNPIMMIQIMALALAALAVTRKYRKREEEKLN